MKTINSFRSKLLALTFALMASVSSFAYEFEYVNDFHIDGFAYSINSASANNDSEEGYVGLIEVADCQKDVLVPKYVSYGDRGFHVTKFGMGSVVFTNEAGSVVESVTIPNTTYVINKNVLAGCPNLKTVVVDSENPYYDSRENCNAIITTSQNPYFTPNTLIAGCKTTIIPNSVVEIGANAFYNCQSLETITIPNSVTKIGRSAFNACSALSSITLSENLTAIGEWAFDDCNNLIEVVCYATQPPTISQYTFSGISPTIYVPAESIEQYRAANGWKDLQIQYISWSEGCEEYKHINLAVQMLPKISSMIFDISNNGTIEPPYVDSVWILKTEQEPLRKLDAQSGDTIDLSFLEENEDYILRVYINGCIKSRTFWHRVIPNNWPDTWCDTWNVMWFDGWRFDETASTSKYRLGKDTVIGDYTYSKFTSRTSVRFTEDWKVYVYYEGFDDNDPYTVDLPTGEYLAYDFSAQVGDTLEVFSGVHSYSKYKCLVREVQTDPETKLRTITLFQLLLEDRDGDGVEEEYSRGEMTWIEGVGSPNGFLINTTRPGGGLFTLLCAYKDDELKYTGDLYDEYGCEYNATEQSPEDLFPTLWGLQRTEVEYHTDGADAPSLVSFEEYTPTLVNGKWYLYDGMNYLREENNQVLLYSPHFEIYKDIVLYDWTLEVGDTLPYYFDKSAYKGAYYVVTNVSTITLLDGKEYKKWTLACGIEYIEGIGAINGEGYGHYLCLQHWDHPATYIGNRLVCASRNGQLLYQMDDTEMERLGAECLCAGYLSSYKSQWCDTWNVLDLKYRTIKYTTKEDFETWRYYLAQDTIINNYTYTAVTRQTTKVPEGVYPFTIPEPEYVAAVRFTDDRKVYIYYDNTEYLLYDFNVQPGDELTVFAGINHYHSHHTNTIRVAEVERYPGIYPFGTEISLSVFPDFYGDERPACFGVTKWVEGVGDLCGFITGADCGLSEYQTALLCAYKDGNTEYTTENEEYAEYGCEYNSGENKEYILTLPGLQRTGCTKTIGEDEYGTVWGARSYLMQEIETATIGGKQYLLFGTNNIYDEYCSLWLREESNKILVYSAAQKKDLVLYDFTLNVGDSLPRLYVDYDLSSVVDYDNDEWGLSPLVVTEVSTITLLDGKEYKKWTFNNGMQYVEGIGSFGTSYGHNDFYQLIVNAPLYSDVHSQHLVCVSKNGKLLYQMDDAEMEQLGAECLCDVEKKWTDTWCDTWNVLEHDRQYSGSGNYNEQTWRHYLAQDTIINGQTYTCVNCYWTLEESKVYRIALVRFTEDKKVYLLSGNQEQLVYDFSVEVGDTIETIVGAFYGNTRQQLVVHQVDIDDATNRKTITLYPLCKLEEDFDCDQCDENGYYLSECCPVQWIEGVGSTDGFLMGDLPCSDWVGGVGYKLLCAYKNDELQYISKLYQGDYGCEYNAVEQNAADLFPTLWGLQRTVCNEYCGDTEDDNSANNTYKQTFDKIFFENDKPYILYNDYLLREEDNKIFLYSQSLNKDIVLYDFTLEVGDSLPDYIKDFDGTMYSDDTLVVTDISSVTLLDGKEYKKWTFDNGMEYVEGIGMYGGRRNGNFFGLIREVVVPCHPGTHLVCVSKNNKLLYQMDDTEMERLGAECLCEYDRGPLKDNAKNGKIGGRPTPTQWNMLEVETKEMDGTSAIVRAETFSYTLENDSIVANGKTYYQLAHQSTKDTAITKSVVGALHFSEDDGNRVYFLRDGVEYVLYDFTAEPGDTIETFAGINNYPQHTTYTHVVVDKDTTEDGACRMFLEVVFPEGTTPVENAEKVWLAGLGSIDGIVHNAAKRTSNAHAAPSRTAHSSDTQTSVMLCAWREDSCLYTTDHPDYDSFGCVYNQDPTSVENTHSPLPMTDCYKLLRDGQLLIIHKGKTYNVLGVPVE